MVETLTEDHLRRGGRQNDISWGPIAWCGAYAELLDCFKCPTTLLPVLQDRTRGGAATPRWVLTTPRGRGCCFESHRRAAAAACPLLSVTCESRASMPWAGPGRPLPVERGRCPSTEPRHCSQQPGQRTSNAANRQKQVGGRSWGPLPAPPSLRGGPPVTGRASKPESIIRPHEYKAVRHEGRLVCLTGPRD